MKPLGHLGAARAGAKFCDRETREYHGFESEEALLEAWKQNKYDAAVVACLLDGQQRCGALGGAPGGFASAASTSDAKAAHDWRMLHSLGALLATAPRAFPYLCAPAPPLLTAPAPSHAPRHAPPHAPPCIR